MVAIHHNIVTGQSLANGAEGDVVSTNPQTNGFLHRLQADGDLEPLDTPADEQFPDRTIAEKAWPGGSYHLSINTHAVGGTAYVGLKKGTAIYEEAMDYMAAGYAAALVRGDTFEVEALHIIHGELDDSSGTTTAQYVLNLAEWLSDYDTDIKAITGQSRDLIGIVSQVHNAPDRVAGIADAQLQSHRDGTTVCVGPRYPFPAPPSHHLDGEGYYHLGEYHGRVHRTVVIDEDPWEPVHPIWIERSGLVVRVGYHVPVPPLVFNTSIVAAQTNQGFKVQYPNGSSRTISSVEIEGDDVVKITLADPPTQELFLVYGTAVGGNLCDSSTDVSALDGIYPLVNWGCVYDLPIPFGTSALPQPPSAFRAATAPASAIAL